jgi:hypothetical protein
LRFDFGPQALAFIATVPKSYLNSNRARCSVTRLTSFPADAVLLGRQCVAATAEKAAGETWNGGNNPALGVTGPEGISMRKITRNITSWKASAIVAALVLALAAPATALAKDQGKGSGGGGGGGGGGHPSGGHPGGGGGGGPHFSAHASTPHFSTSNSTQHFTSHTTTHFTATHTTPQFSRTTPNVNSNAATSLHTNATSNFARTNATSNFARTNNAVTNNHAAFTRSFTHPVGGADPAAFLAHRHFAGGPAFRPFIGRGWHPYHHLGWIGPLFWPYAYGDVFYCSLWPGDYCGDDPFWAYGYGDIYESIFSPYDYSGYVQGPGAPERMASLTQGMTESCDDEAAEVTGWPINQIQDAVQPNPQQAPLLDSLGNAIVQASNEIKTHCPSTVAFTPTDRLASMAQRLQALVDAVNIVEPPLTQFYAALSDEQKARFNDIAPPQPPSAQNGAGDQGQQAPPTIQAQCGANVMAWPGDKIDQAVRPDGGQQAKLQALQSAVAQSGDIIKSACPTELPATPPSRLDAIGKRLQAMLQAVQTVQPALADFYNSLSDDQKARFNTLGQQLFAQNQQ